MKGLLQRWQAHREAKVLARRAIPHPLWQLTPARLPFGRSPGDQLHGLAAEPHHDLPVHLVADGRGRHRGARCPARRQGLRGGLWLGLGGRQPEAPERP